MLVPKLCDKTSMVDVFSLFCHNVALQKHLQMITKSKIKTENALASSYYINKWLTLFKIYKNKKKGPVNNGKPKQLLMISLPVAEYQ